MEPYLHRADRVLDVGCGDGLSSLRFAEQVESVVGLDYVDAFVERATVHAAARSSENVAFGHGDVLDLSPIRAAHQPFDVVITIRCLINLASWENQLQGLAELAACVRPGGLFLSSEGWTDGFQGMNLRRHRAGLGPIAVVPYNRLLERESFEQAAGAYFELVDYVSLGFYIFMSRVMQPRLVAPEAPRHDHPLNRAAAELQCECVLGDEFLDCDYAGVYVYRRKG
ncbi:MAG: class I SAM-dependent methyltransferase [Planctomycetes bacterium]|nr:class I SAM-dependent methyltransferase [Planctomycetota bacterium]